MKANLQLFSVVASRRIIFFSKKLSTMLQKPKNKGKRNGKKEIQRRGNENAYINIASW